MEVGAEDDHLGGHQTARSSGFVRQQTAYDGFVLVVHRVKHLLLLRSSHLPEQVGYVVVFHFVEHAFEALNVERLDDADLLLLGEFFKHISEALVVKGLSELAALLIRKRPDHCGHFGGVEITETSGFSLHRRGVVEQTGNLLSVGESVRGPSTKTAFSSESDFVDFPPRRPTVTDGLQPNVTYDLIAYPSVDQFFADKHLTRPRLKRVEVDIPALESSAIAVELADAIRVDEDPAPLAVGHEPDKARCAR